MPVALWILQAKGRAVTVEPMAVNSARLLRDLRALDNTQATIAPLSMYMQINDPKVCCKVCAMRRSP